MGCARIFVALLLSLGVARAAAQSFEQFHPDQYNRDTGFARYEKGDKEDAARFFLRGARYADKTSQVALALMYVTGDGVARDDATAYAWADIAGERGYPQVIRLREQIWESLDDAQRARALEIGATLYAEYGDNAAKPRLEKLLRRGKTQRIGSRTGAATGGGGTIPMDSSSRAAFLTAWQSTPGLQAQGDIELPNDAMKQMSWNAMMNVLRSAVTAVSGSRVRNYYGPENWDPKFYWRAQDSLWIPDGRVTAGELKKGKGRLRE